MAVRITNFETTRIGTRTQIEPVSYVATSRDECRDGVDAMVFDLVNDMGEDVRMGQVFGEQVFHAGATVSRARKGYNVDMDDAGTVLAGLPRTWAEKAARILNATESAAEQVRELRRITAAVAAQ